MRSKVREGSPRGRSGPTGIGFVKQVDFKPRVKETEEEEVIGEGIGESDMEELVPE